MELYYLSSSGIVLCTRANNIRLLIQ